MLAVRPMTSSDITQVYSIETSAHRSPWGKGTLGDCVLVGYDCRVLEQTDADGSSIIGYIICRQVFNTCHILNFCIAPLVQNQGFGKFLLNEVLNSLVGTLINTVVLEVRPSNVNALALYESLGFKRDEIKQGYYKDEQGEEDALLLKKMIGNQGC